jgi:membrane glycosyltransferase
VSARPLACAFWSRVKRHGVGYMLGVALGAALLRDQWLSAAASGIVVGLAIAAALALRDLDAIAGDGA